MYISLWLPQLSSPIASLYLAGWQSVSARFVTRLLGAYEARCILIDRAHRLLRTFVFVGQLPIDSLVVNPSPFLDLTAERQEVTNETLFFCVFLL